MLVLLRRRGHRSATLSLLPGADPQLFNIAVSTFDNAIALEQQPSGAFLDENGQPNAIVNGFFGVDSGSHTSSSTHGLTARRGQLG